MEVLNTLPDPFKSMSKTMVEICAYAGTGNVLKIQEFLKICSEHYDQPTDKVSIHNFQSQVQGIFI